MASSVARMPTDEWRDPGRLAAAGVFVRPHHRKVLVRNISVPATNSSSSSSNTNLSGVAKDVSNARKSMDESSSPTVEEAAASAVQKRRQSQIIDRWAARQAKEMVTTIERQAYEAELSALAIKQPVSARAATFLREKSPALSESSIGSAARTQPVFARTARYLRELSPALSETSVGSNVRLQPVSARATYHLETSPSISESSAGSTTNLPCSVSGVGDSSGNGISIDLSPNVRASSLIQMWRELEAEAGLTPIARTTSGGCCNLEGNSAATFPAEEPSGTSNSSDEPEAFGDSEFEAATTASTGPAHSSCNESEKSKVCNIVKMLSSGCKTNSSTTRSPLTYEKERAPRKNPAPPDRTGSGGSLAPSSVTMRRVREQRVMEGLVARREQERRREVEELAGRQHVSRFCYRGRLQSMLRLRSLRRQFAVREQLRASSSVLNFDQSPNWSTLSLLSVRQKFNSGKQHCDSRKPDIESSSCLHVQSPTDSESSADSHSADEFAADGNQFLEVATLRDSEGVPIEVNSPRSRGDDPQEGFNSLDGSWDERRLWVNNIDWQRNVESSPSSAWHGELVIEELESYPELNVRNRSANFIGESDDSWRWWNLRRQAMFHESIPNFSDRSEIHELLERRTVSTSLASDFCEKMNRIILAFLRRQGLLRVDENLAGNYEEQPFWSRKNQLHNFEQDASVSSSLVPMPYHAFHHTESWVHNSFPGQSSQNLSDMDVMHDLRSEMEQIRREICELRRMVQSSVQWQEKLQESIKQEISKAISQSAGLGRDSTLHSSNSTSGRKGSCCICYEMQVDSLLYRCGHMCTCFKCAYELQWSSGKCPICRSSIVDVVRTYPNS